MIETKKNDSINIEGKTFVFDNTIAEFEVGGKRYAYDEYDQLGGYPYDAYYGEDDPENSVVKAVLDAGGVVRRKISGKTDYYVVGVYNNKNKDYIMQKEKGKPVVAIKLDDLKKVLGIAVDDREEGKSEFVDMYDPPEDYRSTYSSENIDVEDRAITGEDCADWEYSVEGDPARLYIRDYIGDKEDITIPTSIDGQKVYLPPQFPNTRSFPKCKAKTIRIPGSFKEIPVGLFEYNRFIEEVIVGNGIEVIETNFCFNATNIKKVCFPDSIRSVDGWVLKGTAWYEEQGTEIIAGDVLLRKYAEESHSTNDKTYKVPDGVTVIAGHAFFEEDNNRNPSYIRRVELPSSVRYISDYAFCLAKISSIKIPSSIVHIGKSAFNGTHLSDYYAKKQFFVIGDLLYELTPDESVIAIPDGVRFVADGAVSSFTGLLLEELIFPDSVEEIGIASFAGCTNLKSVKFGNNLRVIGDYAFGGCSALMSVEIPKSVEEIGENAFDDCVEMI